MQSGLTAMCLCSGWLANFCRVTVSLSLGAGVGPGEAGCYREVVTAALGVVCAANGDLICNQINHKLWGVTHNPHSDVSVLSVMTGNLQLVKTYQRTRTLLFI